jgi:hypothetical protein
VYGFEVVKIQTCELGHEHEENIDDCWGFYGDDGIKECISQAMYNVPNEVTDEVIEVI